MTLDDVLADTRLDLDLLKLARQLAPADADAIVGRALERMRQAWPEYLNEAGANARRLVRGWGFMTVHSEYAEPTRGKVNGPIGRECVPIEKPCASKRYERA